jgi:beta-mannosidase
MRLETGWTFAICDAGRAGTPGEALDVLEFSPARVPGTAAAALIEAGRWSWDAPEPLDARDVWYTTDIAGRGAHVLTFEGLATIADVYLDDRLVLRSDNMFLAHDVEVELIGPHRLSICFRALAKNIAPRKGRARWRPRMIQPSDLRFVRTSALGHMPGFAPPAPVVGPWRAISIVSSDKPALVSKEIAARLDGESGLLRVSLTFDRPLAAPPCATCAGVSLQLEHIGEGRYAGELRTGYVRKWFPHTHGEPCLYAVSVEIEGNSREIAKVGFRTVEIDCGADGDALAFRINGVDIFCRGAVWTPLDAVGLQNDPDALAGAIGFARDAGVNMFRVSGVSVYETDAFHRACDEAGVLVWQDFMFSNFDYPAGDADFMASVEREAREFLSRTRESPSLVALCGGNEVYQQAAMMGVAEANWRSPLFEDLLPRIASDLRPDVPYIVNSPSGGALPFQSDAGAAHYYGVGAYRRPLEDARRAKVRFASECLGFANVPEQPTLREDFGDAPLSSPLWASRIPRDQGALQDFEQVRDHYLALLYGVDPLALKREDPNRYLDFSRATVAEVVEQTIAEWRRPGSSCAGALVWFWKDLWPSSGWGVLDWRGRPKSPWWAMRRAFRPVQVVLADEGVNGLHIHCLNERPAPFRGRLSLVCYKDGATIVMRAERDIELAPREALTLRDCELWGAFFDTAYAYRFGPPSHEATVATLVDTDGAVVAESWHFPLGRAAALFEPQISGEAFEDEYGCGLRVSTDRIAQSVKIEDASGTPLDNWLHLAPGRPHLIRFRERNVRPEGAVVALGAAPVSYRV